MNIKTVHAVYFSGTGTTENLRPRQMENADQPASLKACVTGHKDPLSFIKIKKFHSFPLFN